MGFSLFAQFEMPIQSAVDSATGIYVHTVTGALTREDVLTAQKAFYVKSDIDPKTPVLWDARQAEVTSVMTFNEMARMAKGASDFAEKMANGRTAILASSAASFGMGRMYKTLATSLPRQISVFREYQEAVDWLLA